MTFDFAVDYTMIDKRVVTHQHQVSINEPGLESEEMAWDFLKDTFPYQEFEYLAKIQVRLLRSYCV
tara:strand:- start:227 stop:424 length:198 start_codon:yes stop_codon:yes gene_type:complete